MGSMDSFWLVENAGEDQDRVFKEDIPADDQLEIAIYHKRKDWCQYAIDTNSNNEFLDSSYKREQENHHELNAILSPDW